MPDDSSSIRSIFICDHGQKKEQEKERKKRFVNDNRIQQIAKDCLKSELLGHEKNYRRALSVGWFDLSK